MGASRGGSQFLLTSQCASKNTTTTPFASFAPLVRDLGPTIKMRRRRTGIVDKEPDEAFTLSISHKTDKSSEDPDVVLQTLGEHLNLGILIFSLLLFQNVSNCHLSQVLLV